MGPHGARLPVNEPNRCALGPGGGAHLPHAQEDRGVAMTPTRSKATGV